MEGLTLSAAEKKDLCLDEPTKTASLYCSQCRHHLELPTMMRNYMYAHGCRAYSCTMYLPGWGGSSSQFWGFQHGLT